MADEIEQLRAALAALWHDCLASDFNEHWESFQEAEKTLTQIQMPLGELKLGVQCRSVKPPVASGVAVMLGSRVIGIVRLAEFHRIRRQLEQMAALEELPPAGDQVGQREQRKTDDEDQED
jgi:hypothetical protein